MSFSAQTCLTYTGTTTLGGTFNVYTNNDYITPLSSVTLTQITTNCPFIFVVPDGTTSIRLQDTLTFCTVDIPVNSNNLCETCNINFNTPISGFVGTLSVGSLTGDCQNNITEYKINWYGPDNLTTVAFTSGLGSTFLPYQFQHPLTGTTSPPVLAGTYKPIIDKVIISGITFSVTGGTNLVMANTDCLGEVTVSAYTCDNGGVYNLTNPQTGIAVSYDHRLNYTTDYYNTPQPLAATFVLSSNTNYFAYAFKGESIPDTLKITYSGANYPQPYILEYIIVGSDLTNSSFDLRTNIMPKSADTTDYYRRVLCFTGFTNKQDGDILILDVIPNSGNTNWDFYFSCLETFDCSTCLDEYQNQSYKISGSTITATTVDGLSTNIEFVISGCPFNNFSTSSVLKTDFYNYFNVSNTGGWLSTNLSPYSYSPYTFRQRVSPDLFFPGVYVRSCSRPVFPSDPAPTSALTCTQTVGNTITWTKTVGNMLIEFESQNDLNAYYNSYLNIMQYSGTPTNSLDPNYYRFMSLSLPGATTNQQCGDGFLYYLYYIHPSSVVTTGTTITGYSMNLTMPTITNDLGAYSGYNCKLWFDSAVTNINNSSNFTNTTFSNSNGVRRTSPFLQMYTVNATGTPPGGGVTATTMYGQVLTYQYEYRTYAYSSTTASSLLSSYSAMTCNNFSSLQTGQSAVSIFPYYFQVRLTNPLDVNDYQIWATPISNFAYSGYPSTINYELAYDYSGGTVIYSNPNYII